MPKTEDTQKAKARLPEVEKKNIHSIAYLTMLESPKRSMQCTYIWLHLDARAGTNRYVWFDKEKIYNTLKMSKDTYNNYLNELEYYGGIIQFKRYDKESGGRESNIILVCEYDQFKDEFILPSNIAEIKTSIFEQFGNKVLAQNVPVEPNKRKKDKEDRKKKRAEEKTKNSGENSDEIGKPKNSTGVNLKNSIGGKFKISVYPHAKNSVYPHAKFYVYTQTEKLASNNRNSSIITSNNTTVPNHRNLSNHRKEENQRKDPVPSLSLPTLWNNILSIVKTQVSDATYKTWIITLKPKALVNDKLELTAPNNFTKEIAESRYGDIIKQAIKAITGKPVGLEISEVQS